MFAAARCALPLFDLEILSLMLKPPSKDRQQSIAIASFGVVLLHLTCIPFIFGFGAVFWLGISKLFALLISVLKFTGLVSICVCCISALLCLTSARA